MNLTAQIVASGCGSTILRAAQWIQPLQAACDKFEINTPLRVAAFLATIGVESARLTATREDMNYSADRLLVVFGKYFNAATAQQYGNHPQKIASRVYANRNGNGDEASGDGWTYRGGGCIATTGRRNYTLCGVGIDLDLINHPELLEQPDGAAMSAGWFWHNAYLNGYADVGQFLTVSRVVNLGSATSTGTPNGYSERLALYSAAKKVLGI